MEIETEKTRVGLFRTLITMGVLTYIGSAISCVLLGYPMLYLWISFGVAFTIIVIWNYYAR